VKDMKRVLIIFLIIFLAGCSSQSSDTLNESKAKKEDIVTKTMKEMSLDEKISQMLILFYNNDEVDDSLMETIKTYSPGGFILMKENISSYDKTLKFVSDIKENSKIVPIISIDQEGGSVQRLNGLTDVKPTFIPFMNNLGNTQDEELARSVGKVMAEELRTIMVNVDFAPSIDIFSNPNNTIIGKRSFGSDVDTVSKMAISLAKGLEENKVMPVYKHFPGHGDTDVDSHVDLPIVNKSLDELMKFELVPFKEATSYGAKMIMVGHIAVPSITGDNTPASLSKKIVDVLKNDLGYDGLIVTDALNMGALTNQYSNAEIYTKAIDAGCDILLMPSSSREAIDIIKENVSEERIDESVRKILRFKFDYLEDDGLDSSYLGSDAHREIIDKIPS